MRGIEQIPWLYDALMAVSDACGLARWRRRLVGGAAGRTLEVGCGTGRNLPLYPAGLAVIGIDPDPAALRYARRRAPRVPLLAARVEALPFRPGTFDSVVSSLVFCSVADPERGLAEIRRVLRPGGELRMLEHVRHPQPRWAALQDLIQPAWTKVAGGCHPNRATESTVEQAGFRIEEAGRAARGVMRRFAARLRPDHK
ncbi:class I SAM-dependent methyltransferase [Desulfurivibrio sp. C05AmB]|uniref:class I SAM-dependent methyltransferase n=1 Tax=Desulfurivibrio sp. C05AmB TaxID=3374371 RepID=UPI00376EEAAF